MQPDYPSITTQREEDPRAERRRPSDGHVRRGVVYMLTPSGQALMSWPPCLPSRSPSASSTDLLTSGIIRSPTSAIYLTLCFGFVYCLSALCQLPEEVTLFSRPQEILVEQIFTFAEVQAQTMEREGDFTRVTRKREGATGTWAGSTASSRDPSLDAALGGIPASLRPLDPWHLPP